MDGQEVKKHKITIYPAHHELLTFGKLQELSGS